MSNRALHCERTWRRIGMQIMALPPLRQGDLRSHSARPCTLRSRLPSQICAPSPRARTHHVDTWRSASRVALVKARRTTPHACMHAWGVASQTSAVRRRRDQLRITYLSHHTLPVMSVLPCADFAAARLLWLSEFSMSGYGRRVGTVFVTASGPGFSTG